MMASSSSRIISPQAQSTPENPFNLSALLKPLDEILRCRICFEYFDNCMVTRCSHNYCSLCIRRYMNYKAQCPTCFQEASEPELRNNRLIDDIIHTYMKLKENIQNDTLLKQDSKPSETINFEIKKKISSQVCQQDNPVDGKEIDSTSNEVPCPVCHKRVSQDRINVHLDICIKSKETDRPEERRFLPKLVYYLLTEKEIRKKLKDHGLNTAGDKKTLIRRHKNFITLYNANCDALEPRPVEDLVDEIERQEIEEHVNTAHQRKRRVNKKSEAAEIEEECDSYVKEHQSQFNVLLNEIHQREFGHLSIKKEIENDTTESSSSNPSENEHEESNKTLQRKPAKCSREISAGSEKSCKALKSRKSEDTSIRIKQEPQSPTSAEEDTTLSLGKTQDSVTNDLPSIDDYEGGKISKSSVYRKRKVITYEENLLSPKKK